mmetsp:Transcript_9219/g.31869  ORF Transcript_9219/g.31869 Transcript_9219/m.31869 type:complete len:371 (+) Transcript_9219:5572-6684(+)
MYQAPPMALQKWVRLKVLYGDAVKHRVPQHSYEEVGVPEPGGGIRDGLDRARDNLSIKAVGELLHKLRLDRQLLVEEAQVELELVVRSDDDSHAKLVKLRPAGPSQHLHHVQLAQLVPPRKGRVVHLGPLDHNGVGWEVHAPRQGGRGDQDLEVPVREEVLHESPVRPAKAGMVDTDAIRQEVREVGALAASHLGAQDLLGRRGLRHELVQGVVCDGLLSEVLCGLHGLLPAVDEDQDLVLSSIILHLVIAQLIHQLQALQRLLQCDAQEVLLQRAGPEGVVKDEETLVKVHAEEHGHVLVVRQGGAQAHQPSHLVRGLHLLDGPGHDGFQHGTPVIVQEVDLIDDHQLHQLGEGLVSRLARHNVPLLGS